jgi:aldose 1-epimerase
MREIPLEINRHDVDLKMSCEMKCERTRSRFECQPVVLVVSFLFAAIPLVNLSQGQTVTQNFAGIRLFKLSNSNGVEISIANFGAMITAWRVPDRSGQIADVVLGYDDLKSYVNAVDKPYFGAIVGRYGNRIAQGAFSIDGVQYQLAKNNGPNHLHGGIIGFDKVIWDAKALPAESGNQSLELTYRAKDREEGYPGNLDVTVLYTLNDDNELHVDYRAITDKPTHVNLTQHSYFNLKGEGRGDILEHKLMIAAGRYTPVDSTLIPTGELADVSNTPFDFRVAKSIGQDISAAHEQLKFGLGYDHNWVLDQSDIQKVAAAVYEPESGRTLEILTTEPGIQFYCGNFLDGRLTGKSGRPYVHRGGFCLETQHFPDSPNQPGFPTTLLRPGETYQSKTIFRFGSR